MSNITFLSNRQFTVTSLVIVVMMMNCLPVYSQNLDDNSPLKGNNFVSFLKNYINENQMKGPIRGIPVISIDYGTTKCCSITLSMSSLLSEIQDRLPNDVMYVSGRLILINYKDRNLGVNSKSWEDDVLTLVRKDVCDDTMEAKINDSTYSVPCSFKFDPRVFKIKLKKKKIINVEELFL